jgi:hypothetical protein
MCGGAAEKNEQASDHDSRHSFKFLSFALLSEYLSFFLRRPFARVAALM